MAAAIQSLPLINGSSPAEKPKELAIPQPYTPNARLHIHLTILATTIILFVTSGGSDSGTSGAAMGSFVYAMPDRYDPTQPLSTVLYTNSSSLDFATRLAKLLARKTSKAVHVGSSVSFADAAEGGTVEEEMEGFKKVVEVVMAQIKETGTG
ncbi:putative proteasome assembly chaperone 4 [Elsinoe australis]|uniref:Putative proteasome assembly chaperone 4 n=1 Tax=Elsinoe australis TaxID=40998 RepID=A0A4U7BGM8_9PEZI|nr:putative proteasome assembly chaperone 4 [Elsinoe australis]